MRIRALIICILLYIPAMAQYTKAELESKRKEILESIRQTEEQLEATKKNKKATMGQLRALQAKLADRQRLIGNINDEIDQIASNIQQSSNEVTQLKQYLELQKVRYAQSIRYAYENRSSYDMLAFIFSAKDFNDAMLRVKYLKKYRDYRKAQVEQIRVTQGQIEHKIGVLNNQKSQKDELLTSQMQQKQELQKETEETDQVVKELKGQEKQLMTEIDKNRKIATRINKAISEVIRKEIEAERKRAEEARRKEEEEKRRQMANNNAAANNRPASSNIKTTTTEIVVNNPKTPSKPAPSYDLSLTPEAAALSSNFEANRGKLPWPVEKGFISDPYGRHPHPVEKHVMIENDGVDIRTMPNAVARAIFDGTLTKSFFIPGSGWTVILTHGRYFTVYSGLSSVTAKKDQYLHTKQAIGVVGTNDDGEPTINFQIWKMVGNSSEKIDPTPWIAH